MWLCPAAQVRVDQTSVTSTQYCNYAPVFAACANCPVIEYSGMAYMASEALCCELRLDPTLSYDTPLIIQESFMHVSSSDPCRLRRQPTSSKCISRTHVPRPRCTFQCNGSRQAFALHLTNSTPLELSPAERQIWKNIINSGRRPYVILTQILGLLSTVAHIRTMPAGTNSWSTLMLIRGRSSKAMASVICTRDLTGPCSKTRL